MHGRYMGSDLGPFFSGQLAQYQELLRHFEVDTESVWGTIEQYRAEHGQPSSRAIAVAVARL